MNNLINKLSFDKYLIYFILLGSSLLITYIIYMIGPKMGIVVPIIIIGIVFFIISVLNLKFNLYLSILIGNFIFYFEKILVVNNIKNVPTGILVDLLLFIGLLGLLFRHISNKDENISFKNPITYSYLLFLFYLGIQIANPNMLSVEGWLNEFKRFAAFFICFLIALNVLKSYEDIKLFLVFWISIAFLGGLYGCLQEWIGFWGADKKILLMIQATEGRMPFFHAGYMRKFSLYPDPTVFGIFMASSVVLAIIFLVGPYSKIKKMFLLFIIVFILLGLSFSGTRTAYVMLPGGLIVFILMTLNHRRTLIMTVFLLMGFVVLIFGPIYGNATVNRIRTAFVGTEDESFNRRYVKRQMSQQYLYTHPIGGGVQTSGVGGQRYNPGHVLNRFLIDSGYMKTALETGWIGLLIFIFFFYIVLYIGINNYYLLSDPKLKNITLALIAFVFSLLLAYYPQKSIFQLPIGLLLFTSFALILNLKSLDQTLDTKANSLNNHQNEFDQD